MKIKIHCDDGSDRKCYGTVETKLPFVGLSRDDVVVSWVETRERREVAEVQITPPNPVETWLELNGSALSASDIGCIKNKGIFKIEYLDLEHHVCAACGSDQTYDDDGNNISAL